jgi:hypothetical protein
LPVRSTQSNRTEGTIMTSKVADAEWDLSAYFDTQPFWVIWQVGTAPGGAKRIRRITQQYGSEAQANADAERFRKSGTVTWVEKASPLAPLDVPQAAIDSLRGVTSEPQSNASVALATA